MVAPLANALMGFRPVRMLMEKTLGIDHRAPFPTFHFRKFRGWFFGRQMPAFATRARHVAGAPKVAYFHGCATQHYEHEVGKAIVAVLEHNGFEVLLPEQNCCGLPMQSNGNFAEARRYARANLRKLAPYAGQGIPIVVGGTSCGLELKIRLSRAARHPHRRGAVGGRTCLRYQRVPVAPARGGPAEDRLQAAATAISPITPPAIRSCTGLAGRRSICSAWCPVSPSRRWAWIAAGSPALTATSTRSTRLRGGWASRCSSGSSPRGEAGNLRQRDLPLEHRRANEGRGRAHGRGVGRSLRAARTVNLALPALAGARNDGAFYL